MKTYKYNLNSALNIDDLDYVCLKKENDKCTITIDINYQAAYGLGERFTCINQKGLTVQSHVYEKFCNQGEISYCPIPFFFTNTGLGVYVDSWVINEFHFADTIKITISKDSSDKFPEIYFFLGEPKEIISEYVSLTGKPFITPKWSFGPWISANRWNTEELVEEQLELLEKHKFPANVMVLEAWSDEATFYRWNENGEWKNPKEMIDNLHDKGIKLILWQCPIIKKMDEGEFHEVNAEDWKYVKENGLCIKNADGSPYTIPNGRWFSGSMIPDFTNEETINWWFSKRQHLLDIGVDGFKTDGGEFVYDDDIKAHNGMTGIEMKNAYASSYVQAYHNFIGKDRVLFSRAGHKGQQNFPMQWAGDQQSTWDEFRHIIVAGISLGICGVPFWGFDIAGFAGELPSLELYERATQLAVFTPVMQWHSEPVGGQFSEILPGIKGTNDRSPWNMALCYQDEDLIDRLRYHYNLRMNLLPYIYDQARKSSETGIPMMKHLVLDYPDDEVVYNVEDSFILGDILIAPVINEGKTDREVYLPEGTWMNLWNGETLAGNKKYQIDCGKERIPVFVRNGGCIALNLDEDKKLGSYVGNNIEDYNKLCFYLAGSEGEYCFSDDLGNKILITWENGINKTEVLSGNVQFEIINNI
ncbi:glycoside hydrolase family 31 protein [Vallitalea guaymasensis]|uniref:glycoside hydrolase family 31 protein n=1 Tax=Vallitalea guaymasensis TaxID=1185412 RepID=UPI00272DBA92|nr:TIM-barrel domain-containing protein [Vallitalea guaymasensis]